MKGDWKKRSEEVKLWDNMLLIILVSLSLLSISCARCNEREVAQIMTTVSGNSDNTQVYCGKTPPYSTDLMGTRVKLKNSETAINPSWTQLVGFLLAGDDTDKLTYKLGFQMCASFGERVHNNAEDAGIRAAFVVIYFKGEDEPHALDLFNTSDKGLVFVDCTGGSELKTGIIDPETGVFSPSPEPDNYDKVAYVRIGNEYGQVSLSVAEPDYEFYKNYKNKWDSYDRGVSDYTERVEEYSKLYGGKFLSQDAYQYAMERYEELSRERESLEAERKELGDWRWEPLGIVESVEVYW